MTVAVFANAPQPCNSPAPPADRGGYGCSEFLSSGSDGAMLDRYARTATASYVRCVRERVLPPRSTSGWTTTASRITAISPIRRLRSWRCRTPRRMGRRRRRGRTGAVVDAVIRGGSGRLHDRLAWTRAGVPGYVCHFRSCDARARRRGRSAGRSLWTARIFRQPAAGRIIHDPAGGSRRSRPVVAGERLSGHTASLFPSGSARRAAGTRAHGADGSGRAKGAGCGRPSLAPRCVGVRRDL